MTTVPVRRHNHVRRLASDRAFDGVLYTIAAILTLTALYPMYFIIIASISDPSLVAQGKILLLPRGVTLEGYEHLASMKNLWVGYGNTDPVHHRGYGDHAGGQYSGGLCAVAARSGGPQVVYAVFRVSHVLRRRPDSHVHHHQQLVPSVGYLYGDGVRPSP